MEFKKIQISKLSPQQIRKLAKKEKVRIKQAIDGSGLGLIVYPTTYNEITRQFRKNKGIDIILSDLELIANAQQNIDGSGVFGKRFDKLLKKWGVMKVIDKIAPKIKKPLFKAMDIGTKLGKEALMKSKYGVAAVPALDYLNRVSQEYIDKPTEFQKNYKKKLLKHAGDTATQMVEDVAESAMEGLTKAETDMADTKGDGLYLRGGRLKKSNRTPIKKYAGDVYGRPNPSFNYRSEIPSFYYKAI